MAATEPIRNKKHVRQLYDYYRNRGQLRNYLLIVMGVHTALRISDLLRLTWDDVYDFKAGRIKPHIHVVERKTGKQKDIAISKEVIHSLELCAAAGRQGTGRFLFESNRKNHTPISRIQAYRLIRAAASAIDALVRISCHSLRKTFGYHAWKSGVPVAVLMDIYNHSSLEVTRRYLGVSQDDRDKVYLKMSFA